LLPFVSLVILEVTNYDLIPKLGGITTAQLEIFGIINFSIIFLTMPFLIILIINTYIKSEREIQIYAQNLQQQNADLLTINASLEQFSYVVSHDLRSPIASMQAILNLSKTETNLENLREYQKFQEISLKKLDEFVTDILHYSKNTKTEITYTKINFKEYLQEVITQHRYDDNSAAVKISIEIDQKADFYTDIYRMGIIFNNLIANALRYSDLKKQQPNLLIKGFCNENNAIISFIDNGIGIEKEYLEKIFDIFYRANTHAKGTGIGLYLVREYLQKIKVAFLF
jgi:signal transduction histidine kinase